MRPAPGILAASLAILTPLLCPSGAAADPDGAEAAAGLRAPVALAIAGDRVLVADFDDDRVRILNRAGAPLGEWGGSGDAPGRFRGPAGIAIGPDGTVFVTDHYNRRVQRFTAAGAWLASWPTGGADAAPFGIAVDRAGRVLVTDLAAGRVDVWSMEGAPIASWGGRGAGPGELADPWGIAVDGAGDVFVADHGNHRVQRFDGAGVPVGAWGEPGDGDGQLLGPMGLAIARDGSLLVTDLAGDRVRRFSRTGDLLGVTRGAELARGAPAAGVALDADGALILVAPGRSRPIRLAGSAASAGAAAPTEFAILPIAQPLGRGPIALDLAVPGEGTLRAEFFSLDGRRIRHLPAARVPAGLHRLTWDSLTDDGHRAPVGVYFVRVQFEDGTQSLRRSGRVVVLR